MKTYIFGYGSIVSVRSLESSLDRKLAEDDYSIVNLQGYRRLWNVAMDNSYEKRMRKRYFHVDNGEWFDGQVAFMNIEPAKSSVNGILFEANFEDISRFDEREARYNRVDVTDQILPKVTDGVVYVYIAKPEYINLYEKGCEAGTAMISKSYMDRVENSFKELGVEMYQQYLDSTIKPEVDVVDISMALLKK